jgi:hypothetical protein
LPQRFILDQDGLNKKVRRVGILTHRFANDLGGVAILFDRPKSADAREKVRDHLLFRRGHERVLQLLDC